MTKADLVAVWEHPAALTQPPGAFEGLIYTRRRSSTRSLTARRSSESLNVSALLGDGTCEEKGLQENWLGTARKRGSQERLSLLSAGLRGWMRRKVAGSRCRYVSDGYDLDLAYVTSRIIAMGFPGKGSTCFRNPREEVPCASFGVETVN